MPTPSPPSHDPTSHPVTGASTGEEIRHHAGAHRFNTMIEGYEALLDYHLDGDQMVITHTNVPDAVGGRGIASQLVHAAFEHARSQGWRVRPQCSYAAAWAERHPEYSQLLG